MLECRDLTVTYGRTVALDHLNLTVNNGEILGVVGPSGCGKSTLLRVIAGLEQPDSGTVSWDQSDLSETPVHLRRFGLMFQGYALFPHKTVAGNVGFGLKMAGLDRLQIVTRVEEALEWVGLPGYGDRRVEKLSGGEQQRVALARTLAPEPRLVMLDEPLGALDRQLRERLVFEIGETLRQRDTTAIYVTHDHDEAEAISDRVAVMRSGRTVQVGTFDEIRHHPVDAWTAGFLGLNPNGLQ